MSDRIKKIKIKQADGTFSDYIPIGANAKDIDLQYNGDNVENTLKKKPYYYNNVEDMKADDSLKEGDMAITLGYYESNDGGGAEYVINETSKNKYHQEELNNGLYARLIIKNGSINIKQLGAKGDNISDDSDFFQEDNVLYSLDRGTFLLNKDTILNNLNNIFGTGSIKFNNYNYNQNSGIIPINKINDEIFLSMNLPSDGITYMTNRINGNLLEPNLSSTDTNLHGIGAIYKNVNENLPNEFYIYIGKITVFAFRYSTKTWEILKENILPTTIRRYKLPWTGNGSYDINYVYDENKKMYKIKMTKDDFNPNEDDNADGYVLHFWGNEYFFKDNDLNDIIHLACCCECSAETLSGEDITNKLLGVSGIDIINSSGTKQAGYSRNTALNNYITNLIFHTVNNNDYDNYNTNVLYNLFKKDAILFKTLYEDLNHNSFNSIHLTDNIKYYKKLKIYYSFKRENYTENEYSLEIETNNSIIVNALLVAKTFYNDDNNNLNILTNTKEIRINNNNIGNKNRLAIYEKFDAETNKLNQTATYSGANYISINKIIGYLL